MLAEVDSWIKHHRVHLNKAQALKDLLMGENDVTIDFPPGDLTKTIPPRHTNNIWTPTREIKMLRKALTKDYLYTDEEIIRMKRRIRDLYRLRRDMTRGFGFGNGGEPMIDMTESSMNQQVEDIKQSYDSIDKVAL